MLFKSQKTAKNHRAPKLARLKCYFSLTIIAAVLLGSAGIASSAWAATGGSSGTGSGATGGNCPKPGDPSITIYASTCYGATWELYEADSDYIEIPGIGEAPGGAITNCKTYGGSYYRLALKWYNPQTLQPVSHPTQGSQTGLTPVKDIVPPYGSGITNYVGGLSWSEVQNNFERAKAAGITFDTNWADTAWFCWDKDLGENEFVSTSSVEITAAGVRETSDEDGKITVNATVNSETVAVKFYHNITYKNRIGDANQQATFEPATTKWEVNESGVDKVRKPVNTGQFSATRSQTSGRLSEDVVTVNLKPGQTKTVCHKIDYDPKYIKYEDVNGNSYKKPTGSSKGSSQACAKVTYGSSDVEGKGTHGVFSSMTEIHVKPQNGDVSDHLVKSKVDKDAVLILSTDGEQLEVTFRHKLSYKGLLKVDKPDEIEDKAESKWTVTQSGDMENSGQDGTGTYAAGGPLHNDDDNTDWQKNTSSPSVTISLKPGETKQVCSVIRYDKTAQWHAEPIPAEYIENNHGELILVTPAHIEYSSPSTSGRGHSGGCVTVTRPTDPIQNTTTYHTSASGASINDAKPMYAGETSTIGWSAKAKSVATRRISGYEAIAYLVASNVTYQEDKLKGTVVSDGENEDRVGANRNTESPCKYVEKIGGVEECKPFYTKTLNYGTETVTAEHPADKEEQKNQISIAVPNRVGHKYCSSFGYKIDYYYYENSDIGSTNPYNDAGGWHREKTYWNMYDSACAPIAKKPSFAIWNGSIFTPGNIIASASPRFTTNNPETDLFGLSPNNSDDKGSLGNKLTYESWTEFLAVVNSASNFASGAAASRGVPEGQNISALTIAGGGIPLNNSFYTRLLTYLRNQAKSEEGGTLGGRQLEKGTQIILHYKNDLKITGNIIKDSSYNNIYEIPQLVLFVDGNVEIDSNVTQIDAWIITEGTINTCSSFENKNSETKATELSQPGDCDKQLVFNGPISAKDIELNRTGGADPLTTDEIFDQGALHHRYTPAEIFNFSAENYLWAYAQAGRYTSSYTEAYVRELAPRY